MFPTRCVTCFTWYRAEECPVCTAESRKQEEQELIAAQWPFVLTKDDQAFLRTQRIALVTPNNDHEDDGA